MLTRLLEAIDRRGLTIFAEIDHAAAARDVGMELADEVVVVFGNPRAGTPLMQEEAQVGIELPLRILFYDEEGQTLVGYNDPRDLARAYTLTSRASMSEPCCRCFRRWQARPPQSAQSLGAIRDTNLSPP